MSELSEARARISEIDEKIAVLFEERMAAVKDVAKYKEAHGLPIFDAEREASLATQSSSRVKDPEVRSYYVSFHQSMMNISKKYQHFLMEGARVAYSGVEGAFAHIASRGIFPDAQLIPFTGFPAAYAAVENGECDCAVLPIDNSYAGEVATVIDLMYEGSLFINGVYDLHVSQNLLALPGAHLEDITTVISHPQALDQCDKYLRENHIQAKQAINTAMAAKKVAEMGDIHTGAIASRETADLYGLNVIDHDINESRTNTTRFAIFSRSENVFTHSEDTNFILLFTVRDQAGALAKAIDIIGKYGFNMRVLRSRPMKEPAWQYYFYIEAVGNDKSEDGQKMLADLSAYCEKIKVVGRYSTEMNLTIDQWEY